MICDNCKHWDGWGCKLDHEYFDDCNVPLAEHLCEHSENGQHSFLLGSCLICGRGFSDVYNKPTNKVLNRDLEELVKVILLIEEDQEVKNTQKFHRGIRVLKLNQCG